MPSSNKHNEAYHYAILIVPCLLGPLLYTMRHKTRRNVGFFLTKIPNYAIVVIQINRKFCNTVFFTVLDK